jgi:integrase
MAWQLAVWLGNRSGELRGLRWESIVWEHNTILIRESVWEGKSTLPKTKKGYRKVVLTDEQMEVLREYKEKNFPDAQPDAWVLPGKRGQAHRPGLADVKTHQAACPQAWHSGTSLARSTALEQLADAERGRGCEDPNGPIGTNARTV